MDDIDHTYFKLKKPDFTTMKDIVNEHSDRDSIVVNPITFELEISRQYYPLVRSHGWTEREFNRELNRIIYDNK